MSDPAHLIVDETGTQRLVGYTLDVGQPDRQARCHLAVDDRHTNRHDVLHGGIAAMLLDSACGATASLTVDDSGRRPFLTISLNIDFVGAGRQGGVTATGRVVGGGRSLLFVAGELVHDDGTLIATAAGVFKRVPGGTGTREEDGR